MASTAMSSTRCTTCTSNRGRSTSATILRRLPLEVYQEVLGAEIRKLIELHKIVARLCKVKPKCGTYLIASLSPDGHTLLLYVGAGSGRMLLKVIW